VPSWLRRDGIRTSRRELRSIRPARLPPPQRERPRAGGHLPRPPSFSTSCSTTSVPAFRFAPRRTARAAVIGYPNGLRNVLRFGLLTREASPPAEECRKGRQVEAERDVEISHYRLALLTLQLLNRSRIELKAHPYDLLCPRASRCGNRGSCGHVASAGVGVLRRPHPISASAADRQISTRGAASRREA